jgi:hypothetical protein
MATYSSLSKLKPGAVPISLMGQIGSVREVSLLLFLMSPFVAHGQNL